MSEYWVSKKKYYCQYCEIYIADDAPSRSQHENGLRHKGNKDRYIRGLYKSGVKKKQESEEEKREMKRVEEAAQAAYARDVSAGLATPGASSSKAAAPVPKPKPPPQKPSDPYANYTTAASLGFNDPDLEFLTAQAEARNKEGRAGDWVAVVPPPPPLPMNSDAPAAGGVKSEPGTSVDAVRKREGEPMDDDDDARHFKMRKKTVSVGLGEIYDPGIIQIKPRAEPKAKAETEAGSVSVQGKILGGDFLQVDGKREQVDALPNATEKPAWTRREWKWAGEEQPSEEPSQSDESHSDALPIVVAPVEENVDPIKPENDDRDTQLIPGGVIKEEPTNPQISSSTSTPSLFRKRKTPGGTSSTRGRRQD